ncbi:MAG: Wzz/FepE/Etk N-terminal domain-containing protein [Acidimicrobiales bacterium]
MTTKLFFKRYWRVPVVALLGALIAFGGSFMLEETYTSTTRVLIRGLDANLTTTPGAPVAPTGQVDATGARSFAETQAGLASSREVAERVVDQLGLDQPKPDSGGPIHTLAKGAAWTYAHARAILTFGFYKEAERREKAIGTVQGAVSAHQLGTTSGGATGQPASYVLEITANGTTPTEARDIANTSADILVDISNERYATDSANYIASLEGQLDQTNEDVAAAADAVAAYKGSHNISALDEQLVGNAQSAQSLTDQIRNTTNDIAADQGTVASLQATLAATDPTVDNNSAIQTGRSTTDLNATGPNPVHQDLQTQLATAQAKLKADQEKLTSLQGQVGGDSPTQLTADQSGLLQVQQQLALAQDNQKSLNSTLATAKVDASSGKVDLTRISVASLPTYPSAPKRYLFLLLGLLVGGLAGGGLTWLAQRRKPSGDADDDDLDPRDRELLDTDVDLRTQELNGAGSREPVGAGAGPSASGPAAPSATGATGASGGGGNGLSSLFGRQPGIVPPTPARRDADLTDPDQQ